MARFIAIGVDPRAHRNGVAVLATPWDVDGRALSAVLVRGEHAIAIAWLGVQHGDIAGVQLVRGVADHGAQRRIERDEAAVDGDAVDRVRGIVDYGAIALIAGARLEGRRFSREVPGPKCREYGALHGQPGSCVVSVF